MTLHDTLLHAITEYDRKQSTRKGYNMWALPQYIARVTEIEADIESGTPMRKALTDGFTGRLLDAVLKAVGEPKSTEQEQRGNGSWSYKS